MKANANVLIVDDETNAVRVLSAILRSEGYTVHESYGIDKAISIVHQEPLDAIITDIKMPGHDGYHLFDYVTAHRPHIPVIFLTAFGNIDSAIQAISNGAYYYFIKPPDYQKLKNVLAKAIAQRTAAPHSGFGQSDEQLSGEPRLISRMPAMEKVFRTMSVIKDSESSVLICGETGTGKEIVATQLHRASVRRDKPFVAVNCAAIPRELLEAELFGFEKGAFTGASSCRIGKIEEASGGTLFLDEIGEMEPRLQAKLLRVLQERTITRLGSNKPIKVDFRLISSTNRNLKTEMESGAFRPDLFYRVNVVCIELPPLRERKEDIPLLTKTFMNEFCGREEKRLSVSDEVMNIFLDAPWPGNIRQLRNAVEHAVVICSGSAISVSDLPDDLHGKPRIASSVYTIKPLKSLERQAIMSALAECDGNKSLAARQLGISRKTLYMRLKEC